MRLPVHRIIPFSNVEGQGNRTGIFVQGCNANCLYCHNSETIPKVYDGISQYTVDELVEVIKGHMPFIRGITVSGGEATLYHRFLTELFIRVKQLGITCYVDSNGFFDQEQMKDLIAVTDKFLFDVKGIGQGLSKLCFSALSLEDSHGLQGYDDRFEARSEHIANLKHLLSLEKIEEIRLVYVKGYYDAFSVIDRIAEVIEAYPEIPLKLIRVHVKGLPKERLLQLKGAIPTVEEVKELEAYAKSKDLKKVITIY